MSCLSYGNADCDMCKGCTQNTVFPCKRFPCLIRAHTCKVNRVHTDCKHYGDTEDLTPCDPLDCTVPVVIDWNDERDEP
jgi:hypothetical protein